MTTTKHLKNTFVLLGILLLTRASLLAQTSPHVMNSSGTFTVPANVTSITVEAWGGGGAGSSPASGAGGGGGGGAYSRGVLNVTPGQIINVTVGTGGSSSGSNGGNTIVGAITANGGNGANNRIGGNGGITSNLNATVLASFAGGDGGNGRSNSGGSNNEAGGGGGGSAWINNIGGDGTNGNGNSNSNIAGGSGTGDGGGGAAADGTPPAEDGIAPGGGGGGRGEGGGGFGAGANGRVSISWFIPPNINVIGNSTAVGDTDNSPSNAKGTLFPATSVIYGESTSTFTIQNTGLGPLTISSITFTGTNAADFSVSSPPDSPVAPGGSTTFTVSFIPSSTGTKNAVLNIENNTPGAEGSYTFAVRGSGIAPDIHVRGNGNNINNGQTTPLASNFTAFGSVTVGESLTRTFTIQNTNTTASTRGSLEIGDITITGAEASDFVITALPPSSLPAGSSTQSTTFEITFTPADTGARNAIVSIASNDPDENPYTFAISGNGLAPEINLTGNSINIASGSPAATNNHTAFGSVNVTNGEIERTFTIQNTGNAALTIGTITLAGPGASHFSISQLPLQTSINGGGSTTFKIKFNPNSEGVFNAVITIPNNDSNENPYIINISGAGTLPEINVTGNGNNIIPSASPLTTNNTDFGSLTVSTGTVIKTFFIHNVSGSGPLTVGTITVSGAGSSDYAINQPASPFAIAVGASASFTVTFNPSVGGVRNAVISIPNDDADENPYTFNITGTGTAPEMEVRGNSVVIADGSTASSFTDGTKFPAQYIINEFYDQTFVINNLGLAPLTLTLPASITGTNASDFTIISAPAATVAAGASTSFIVRFDPNGSGVRSAAISITNNDPNENPYNFNISGTGNLYMDSDRDGITDEVDIDDDNDGILDSMEQSACAVSSDAGSVYTTFLNETFGSGTVATPISANLPATTSYTYISGTGDVNDGMYSVRNTATHSSWAATYWYTGGDHTGDTNGKMAIFNATNTPGEFYRTTITGLTPNIPVKYSFWVINLDRNNAQDINTRTRPNVTVQFRRTSNNTLIKSLTTGNIAPTIPNAPGSWQNFSEEFTTTESSFTVIFINNAPGGLGNDLALDDIVITQQYCDLDRDNNPDIFDLDADNDGIPDIVEAGFKQYSGNKSRMNIENTSVWTDVNGNGMNDAIDPAIIGMAAYMAMLKDSDGDQIYDFMDLDSDNDGIFDIDEAQADNFASTTTGDADVDGDGVGDGGDTDGDGIRDIHDDLNGYGTTFKAYPVDTDLDGRPDYIDTKSNGIAWDISLSGVYANLDANNDGVIDNTTDADRDGVMSTRDGDDTKKGSPRNLTGKKLLIDFDGRNDYAEAVQVLSGRTRATLMAWIKLDASFVNLGRIIGQDNFYIGVNAAKQLTATGGGNTYTFTTTPLDTNRWYHVAAVYNGSTAPKLSLYLNGKLLGTNSGGSGTSLATSTAKFTIAKNATSSANYFRGFIDEVRVFGVALSEAQIQKMVCQEIKQSGTGIIGESLPKLIESVLWADLLAYYRMDNFKGDVIDNHITAAIDEGTANTLARIYNVKYLKPQSAPMPYVTTADTTLESSIADAANFINGSDISNSPAAIINVKHNVTLSSNQTLVGMVVDAGKTLTLDNHNKLENTWNLYLNGKIDLQGRSQLVQTSESTFTGSGTVERDQQGTSNLYNYNYWSSPVSTSASNGGYSVHAVMKNGSDAENITDLSWTGDADGFTTGNIVTLSDIWIYKFQSSSVGWDYAGTSGTLSAGQGYTLKGSGSATANQNYAFRGVPNNGTITIPVAAESLSLIGNPYPSAINAEQFIRDNLPASSPAANPGTSGALTGQLYFWEHSPSNNTHIFADYQGSYAARNLTGYTPPAAPEGISGAGGTTKVPKEFIPIGQGFFVQGTPAGGNITFKNSQRGFQKEDGSFSNVVFRSASAGNNENDPYQPSLYPKIRLGFDSPDGYHRQLLLGFMGQEATEGLDIGFDAENFDANPCDMTFSVEDKGLVIQGVGEMDQTAVYPLTLVTNAAAPLKIGIDDLENMDEAQQFYIYDNQTMLYHNIKDADFEITLDPGTYSERFSLRLSNTPLSTPELPETENFVVAFSNFNSMLDLRTAAGNNIQSVSVYNTLGQIICEHKDVNNVAYSLSMAGAASGTYIVKVYTDNGVMAKKFIRK